MGINYYVYLRHRGPNGAEDCIERCHIGRNQHLDFVSLARFLLNMLPDDSADYRRLKALWKLVKKQRQSALIQPPNNDIFEFLVHCYEHYTDDSYSCEDEYEKPIPFRNVLERMRTGEAGSFAVYANGFRVDGLYLDMDTGFF